MFISLHRAVEDCILYEHVPWDHTGVHLECTDLGKYEEVVHYMGLEWALTL